MILNNHNHDIHKYINNKDIIADLGCGQGSSWWNYASGKRCKIDAFDMVSIEPKNSSVCFTRANVEMLFKKELLKNKYDLVVANHIFEHVIYPERLAESASHLLKMGGLMHVGIPDATNFTDRIYRLIFRGGGHINKYTRDSFADFIKSYGFKILDIWKWPDDYSWLSDISNKLEKFGMDVLEPIEIEYVANILCKELTLEKGYWYGWGFLLQKSKEINIFHENLINNLEIIEVYPNSAKINVGFQIQPNGLSAIAIEAKNVTQSTCILFNDIELDTIFDGNSLLTAIVPYNLLSMPGEYMVKLYDFSEDFYSEPRLFTIYE